MASWPTPSSTNSIAAKPEDFTALRTELAAAAKGAATRTPPSESPRPQAHHGGVGGQPACAGRQAAQERIDRPWERLRDAHAEMDGERIRELSTEQRRLVDELANAGFGQRDWRIRPPPCATTSPAPCRRPSPIPMSRRGWAAWSRPNDGPDSANSVSPQWFPPPPGTTSRRPEARAAETRQGTSIGDRRRQQARAALAAAERTKAEADAALTELQSDLAAARLRHQDARRRLRTPTRADRSRGRLRRAKQASRDAASLVKEAKATLRATTK